MMINMNRQTLGGIARPARLPQWLADEIEEDVLAQGYPDNAQLPTETVLAQTYGVSRQVVREAARLLEDRGLVSIRAGRGMTVAAAGVDNIVQRYRTLLRRDHAGFEHLMQLRQMSEIEMAALAATHRTSDDVDRLKALLEDRHRAPRRLRRLARRRPRLPPGHRGGDAEPVHLDVHPAHQPGAARRVPRADRLSRHPGEHAAGALGRSPPRSSTATPTEHVARLRPT